MVYIRDLLIKSSWSGKNERRLWVKNGLCGLHYLAAPELVQMAKWYGVAEDGVTTQQERMWDKQHDRLFASYGTPHSVLETSRAFQTGYARAVFDVLTKLRLRWEGRAMNSLTVNQPCPDTALNMQELLIGLGVESTVEISLSTTAVIVAGTEVGKLMEAVGGLNDIEKATDAELCFGVMSRSPPMNLPDSAEEGAVNHPYGNCSTFI
jgi:hypothetical protein